MKILYAIQATGNGHLARAREIIPRLAQKVEVDILISGIQGDLSLPYPVAFRMHGLSYIFGKHGRIDLLKTLHSLRPIRLWRDINDCPVDRYDLVIHDFEPITAHACKRKGIPNISLSHQAAFYFSESPRPEKKNLYAEWILRHYAPADRVIGLHFENYHPSIFTPVIRREIRNLKPELHDHVVVYLPAYCPYYLSAIFQKIPTVRWKIFTRHIKKNRVLDNIEIFPVGTDVWLESLRTCQATIIGAGFEGPSEVLFLGKNLLIVPMKNQYEQECNASALQAIGVKVLKTISCKKISEMDDWLRNSTAITRNFPDNTDAIINHILKAS
jgi:uncharacterized protein (TIGR00661 family)